MKSENSSTVQNTILYKADNFELEYYDVEVAVSRSYTNGPVTTIDRTGGRVHYLDGLSHGKDDEPAEVASGLTLWRIHGALHRVSGPAIIRDMGKDSEKVAFALYGAIIPENEFHKVVEYAGMVGCPLWVSWLKHIGLVNEEDLTLLTHATNDWKNTVPHSWIVKTFNITELEVSEVYKKIIFDKPYNYYSGHLVLKGFEYLTKVSFFEMEKLANE